MILKQYIRPECFMHDLRETDREGALRAIVKHLRERGCIRNEEEIFSKLVDREKIQSTAVGNAIAIPHCFTDEIVDLIIVVARSPIGLDFQSFDGKPTKVIFLLLGNKQNHGLHLKALARIARLIKNTQFIEKVVAATSVADMVAAFTEEEAKI
jgi:fructose-specific phosphotransferase system IIA component